MPTGRRSPGRRSCGWSPRPDRPIASVQGVNDPFGTAAELAAYLPEGAVYPVTGTHSIPRGSAAAVAAAVLHFTGPLRPPRTSSP